MKNLYQDKDDRVDVPAPSGGCVSGQGYVIGSIFGVAMHDAAEGALVTLRTRGIIDLPKSGAGSVNFAVGAKVFWDNTNKLCIASAAGAFKIGTQAALVPAANADTYARVLLNGTDVTAV